MANDLTAVVPELLSQGLRVLRSNITMPLIVTRAPYDSAAAQKGDLIEIPVPSEMQAKDVVPSQVDPAPSDIAPTRVTIPLDQWKYEDFTLTDKEYAEVLTNEYLPLQAESAVKALAEDLSRYLLNLAKGFYGYVGTAATTPFSVGNPQDAIDCRRVLNEQLAPMMDRYMVLDPTAEASALALQAFHNAQFGVGADAIINGDLTRRFGFDILMDQQVQSHIAGDAAGYQTAAAGAVGDTQIAVDTGAGTFEVGDIIEFAGHSQTYVVTQQLTGAGTLQFSPSLQDAVADNETIVDPKADHVMNLAMQRGAIGFAMRELQNPNLPTGGNFVSSAADPVSGIVLRLQVREQWMQTSWVWDILYGAAVIRRELGVRLAG